MTENKLFPEERKQRIIERLKQKPKVLVADLSEEFGVSQFTVRADLDELEREGKLCRCHGGALSVEKSGVVVDYSKRKGHMTSAKRALGELAATLVDEGDCIAVDTGTTTIELIRSINPRLNITIVTNDFSVADLAEERLPSARVLFLGGFMRRGYRYTTGVSVLNSLRNYHTDKAFLSTSGLVAASGFMSEDPEQAEIKRAYFEGARKRYVLADNTKFGLVSLVKFADISEVDAIVTDIDPGDEAREAIRANGGEHCQILVAK